MFPFWENVIAPVIEAVGARRVVEIGALRGETTVRMLERLGPECELHVIDPLPQFDPAEHERAFPGRYIFHLGISHDVLPGLPPADVALVDGDHNWFTVFHELRMLAATAADAGRSLPVLVLHDVCWPYGRRDLYYEPSRIPEEFRQPYRKAGMRPGVPRLFRTGGMNLTLDNAETEGGPRNGVMTALDDFMAEHPVPLRRVVLPLYYGLAIVAEEQVLEQNPTLRELFDRFDAPQEVRSLVEMTENIRLDEAIFGQAWIRTLDQQIERGAARYLAIVKAALLDQHYLENELRIAELERLSGDAGADRDALRDPARMLTVRYHRLAQAREAGERLSTPGSVAYLPYTDMGQKQLDHLEQCMRAVITEGVPGDIAEVGTGRGGGGIFLRAALEVAEDQGRTVWVADRFPASESEPHVGGRRLLADLSQVQEGFDRFGLADGVRFLQGVPQDMLAAAPFEQLALVRVGEGIGKDRSKVLEAVHARLSPGAFVIVAGTSDPEVAGEVEASRQRAGLDGSFERIGWDAVAWRMPPATDLPEQSTPPTPQTDTIDLSVVVVFYNMRREAERTLQSLARSYQRKVEDLDYEVVVVDNGSDADQRLTPELVASFGPEFRLLEMGDEAQPSPIVALNMGISMARGSALALMIDGAHVLTPGVLHHGMLAMRAYEPAVVATQQWYLGPGQQGDAQQAGYDQHAEDLLLSRISWPADGYRLFEIGHFIGERDWFDGMVESNCLFVPRKLLEQVGVFDTAFDMPGGGYANLELFERLTHTPGVECASILGEGTFHQFHGGTTTNVADEALRRERIVSYREHFLQERGRTLNGLDRPTYYVGAMSTRAARRTRSRRAIGLRFDPFQAPTAEETASTSVPIADELKLAAIEGVWKKQAWRQTTWLGHPVNRFPSDLHAYQELIARLDPALVVIVADDFGLGGRALHAATVLEQIGQGRVLALGEGEGPSHARITYHASTADLPGDTRGPALVFLGLQRVPELLSAFERFAPLVAVDGYVVVENTVLNGRPAEPGFGPGPHEAVVRILERHSDFVADPAPERYTVTFNRNGYLRRVRAPATAKGTP